MIDLDAYPIAIPLCRDDAEAMLARPEQFPSVGGAFVSWVKTRGKADPEAWQLAGQCASLSEAFHCLGEFAATEEASARGPVEAVRAWLKDDRIAVQTEPQVDGNWGEQLARTFPAYRLIFLAEGNAASSWQGCCIIEVEPAEGLSPLESPLPTDP